MQLIVPQHNSFNSSNLSYNLAGGYLPPATGLYFQLGNHIYLPGQSINILDIGEQPGDRSDPGSTLVCVTTNVNRACCRGSDGGNVGQWYFPNGVAVNRPGNSPTDSFYRVGHEQQVRLAHRSDATGLLGLYRCEVPDEEGNIASASIIISGKKYFYIHTSELIHIYGSTEHVSEVKNRI